jgi:short-subunit dehydrogenase
VIAGASEGIGASFARRIAANGVNVVLVARRAGPLDALAAELRESASVKVRSAAIDLTSPTLLDELAGAVDGVDVGLLVYNAGAVHGARFFVDRPVDDALQLVDLNCRGVVVLTHHFGAAMAERGRGGIVLMSSMSAVAGAAYTAAYSATKAFDLVLAEGLWMELGQRGVDVLGVPAGLTDTPAMRESGIVGDGREGGFESMAPDDVAREALDALATAGPMLVPGETNRALAQGLWPVPRADLVTAMSAGAASLYELEQLQPPASD